MEENRRWEEVDPDLFADQLTKKHWLGGGSFGDGTILC